MKQKLLKSLLLLMLPCMTASAQDINMKFGKPTKEEMQMTTYAAEPDAEAVVLCRLTDVNYTVQQSGYLVDYHEKIRIKVLKPEGQRAAHVVIPYLKNQSSDAVGGSKFSLKSTTTGISSTNSYFDSQNGSLLEDALGNYSDESVEDLKATAFNLENGKVVKSALKKDDIVKKEIDNQHHQIEFTVPDVKAGTVIEVEYCVHSELFWQLRDWFAQREIPVAYAKLDMEIPNYLIFNLEEHGIQRLTCTCVQGTMRYKLESDPLAAPTVVNTNHYVCVGRNLTAMPKDDFVWNTGDHCAGITAELKQYSLRGTMLLDYAKTWEQIDQMLLEDAELGKQLDDHSPLATQLKEAKIEEIASEQERAAAVFKLVMSQVDWDGTYKIWPANTAETLKKRSGSNADINMLLIQSLQEVGVNAAPVVLRTRDLGLLPHNFPSITKLSSFVVAIVPKVGSTYTYLDASSKNGYLNVLAEPLLVEKARLVMKGKKSQWVNLQKISKSQKSTIIDAVLSADGKLTGTQTTRYEGLAAMKYRQEKGINDFGPDATETKEFNVQGEVTNGQITVCPYPQALENPFKAETRKMPVEFPSLGTERVVMNIALPEGMSFTGEPRNTIITTPDKGLEGRIFTTPSDGKVQMSSQFSINKIAHSEKSYTDLKQIFDMLTTFTTEKMVVK
jgi:hypothetical protein